MLVAEDFYNEAKVTPHVIVSSPRHRKLKIHPYGHVSTQHPLSQLIVRVGFLN
jgi:hypothetical protein